MGHLGSRLVVPLTVTGLFLSACGSSSNNSSQRATAPVTSTSAAPVGVVFKAAHNPRLGTILVTAQGFTLYRLSGEHAGKLICTSSACVRTWHPLTVAAGSKPGGSVASLSVIKRPDGTEQVTYRGMPLYTFAQDKAPGQAKGQGIKDVGTWMAVTVSANKGTPGASSGPNSYGHVPY